jgi:tetratricopeptide (TPR) repeat protein
MQPDFSKPIQASLPTSGGDDRWSSIQQGHWKLVKPEELSRAPIEQREEPTQEPETPDPDAPRVELNRRQELEHHLKESPTDLDAFLELGQIYRAENRPIDARRVLEQAVEIFPDEPGLRWEFEEAVLARSLQQLREVSELAGRLNNPETDREWKRCKDDWAHRRMEICRARLNRDSSLNHLRIVLAEGLHDAGMHEAAIEELESVLEIDELSPTAYLIQGQCLLSLGKDLDAMASLRAASMRRSVVAPVRLRIATLKLLCDTAEKLGVTLTLGQYQQHLQMAEQELAKQSSASKRS